MMNGNTSRIAVACLASVVLAGCTHSQVVAKDPAAVVLAAQSLAPWSNPPRYTTTEVVPNQEWSVVITEPVPGEKFEHHEIIIRVVRVNEKEADVSVTASHINSFMPQTRKTANRVARRYGERLTKTLKQENPQQSLPQVQL